MPRPRRLAAAALVTASGLALSGCFSLGGKPPKALLSLQSAAVVAPGQSRSTDDAHAVAVTIPNVQPGLATQRIMVQDGANTVAYVKDAAWTASPGLLFRNLLAETIEAKTGRFVPDQRATGLQPDTRVSGQLVAFGLDAASQDAVVTFDGVITRTGSGKVQTRRFTARAPVSSAAGVAVGAAINQAANQVAADVAGWVGG